MERQDYIVNQTESSIGWTGKKMNGSCNGTINISGGTLTVDNGNLIAGEFVVDTRSIRILDITDPDTNDQFRGHLASEDFFASEEFPTAKLEISNVSKPVNRNYHIIADLTIRGIKQPIAFDAEVAKVSEETLKASGRLIIDRTKYNMKFRSGRFFKDLGSALIDDDFILDVQLTARHRDYNQ